MCGYFILYPKSNIRNDILDLILNIKKTRILKLFYHGILLFLVFIQGDLK